MTSAPPRAVEHAGGLAARLFLGTRWSWRADRHASALPPDLDASIMALEGGDRHHRKQGRSTARVRFDAGAGGGPALSVYLKRHYRLPAWDRFRALVHPGGRARQDSILRPPHFPPLRAPMRNPTHRDDLSTSPCSFTHASLCPAAMAEIPGGTCGADFLAVFGMPTAPRARDRERESVCTTSSLTSSTRLNNLLAT